MRSKALLSGALLAVALAPQWTLKDLSGKTLSSKDLRGKVVLLDFWASWCSDCAETAPLLQAEYARYKQRGFTVVGVLVEDEPKDAAKFAKAKELTYPIVVDGKRRAFSDFGVRGIPTAVLIDGEGRERARWVGASPGQKEKLERALVPLLPPLPKAGH